MADKEKLSHEEQRKKVAEELWLNYFNQTLFESGLITEQMRNKMTSQICSRSSASGKQKRKKQKDDPGMEL